MSPSLTAKNKNRLKRRLIDTHAIIKVQTVKKGCSSLDNKGGDLDVNFRNAAVVSVDHHDRLWYLRIHKEITAP